MYRNPMARKTALAFLIGIKKKPTFETTCLQATYLLKNKLILPTDSFQNASHRS